MVKLNMKMQGDGFGWMVETERHGQNSGTLSFGPCVEGRLGPEWTQQHWVVVVLTQPI